MARRQASEQASGHVEDRATEAPAPRMQPQRRRIRRMGGTSSTESASPPDFPGAPVLDDDDADRQAETAVKTEADLQEDAALAASLNTALPCGHEDEGEVAATQMDEAEEEDEEEGEEEEYQQDQEEEEVASRQAQVAPPPQEGVVEQGDVISQCLRSQARARRQGYKGAQASAAAAIACVPILILLSTQPARRCRSSPAHSHSFSFTTRVRRLELCQTA